MFRCELCDRWFCEKHLQPRLIFIRGLEEGYIPPESKQEFQKEWANRENSHPDFQYSRRRIRELDIEEKRRNELIKQALDRMNHYYDEVEIPAKHFDVEAHRKKTVEILLEEERETKEIHEEDVKSPVVNRYGFSVPLEVYSSPEYREYLNHADNMKSVKVIVEEYYRKYHPKRKEESEVNEPQKEDVKSSETITTFGNFYGYRFVVPSEVYSNATYREYLNYARNEKSVRVIVDEYYRKYPKRKKDSEKPNKKK